MSYYNLGKEVHTTETYSKIAEAINEDVAKVIVDALNAAAQSVQADVCPTCHGDKGAYLDGHWTDCIGCNATGKRC